MRQYKIYTTGNKLNIIDQKTNDIYYLRKNKTPISYNDVITGAWFALLTTLIYNLYV